MSDIDLAEEVSELKAAAIQNRLFCKIFFVITFFITLSLSLVLSKGIPLLNEKSELSAQHRVSQVFIGSKALRKTMESQLDDIDTPGRAITADSIKKKFTLDVHTLEQEEQDLSAFITNYQAVLTGIAENIGNLAEWQHFSNLRLQQLQNNSQERSEQLLIK